MCCSKVRSILFFFPAEAGIRDWSVTGVQTCALPICGRVVSPSKALYPPHAIGIDHEANTEQLCNAGVHPRGIVCRAPAEHLHWRDTGENRVGDRKSDV